MNSSVNKLANNFTIQSLIKGTEQMVSKPSQKTETHKAKKSMNFDVMYQTEVPHGRNGKHKNIVSRILDDLDNLKEGKAIRIRLDELPDSKERIRAALSRAVRQRGVEIITSTDDEHLYIWHSKNGKTGNGLK